MAFYHKILFIILVAIFIPVFVFAQNQDFLSITGTLFSGQISLNSVEQRVFDKNNVELYKSGSYEARVLKGKKIISNNFFEIVENPELWVDEGHDKPEGRYISSTSTFNVKLPLTENLDAANSVIEIWKGNTRLISKSLIEIPVEVLDANSYSVIDQRDYPNLYYLFHLYYDNGQLLADRDFEFKYDVIPEEFQPETIVTPFPYKGEVVNFLGQVAETFQFDPGSYGNSPGEKRLLVKGKISVKAPYVPDARKVVFYDSQGRALLTVFVDESSFCNDDGVCNSERGEDSKTCPNDCRGLPTTDNQSPPQRDPAKAGQPTTGERGMPISTWALIIAAVAAVAAGGWYGWRRYKEINRNREMEKLNRGNAEGLESTGATGNRGNSELEKGPKVGMMK